MKALFLIFMFVIGCVLGSFACCQARRLHNKEQGQKITSKWSVCESCGKRLSWSENLPLFSWLIQKGQCKKCHAKIGLAEPLAELGLGLVFLALGFKFYPSLTNANGPNIITAASLLTIIALATALALCFIYDALWGALPTKILHISIVLGGLYLLLDYLAGVKIELWSLLAGLGILPGVYYLLYLFSGERLVGAGDWLLCLPLALILHNFWLCFFLLFLANFLATVVNLPRARIKAKTKKPKHQFPFAPFLLVAFLLTYFFSAPLLALLSRLLPS